MLDDLIHRHKLVGLTRTQLEELLGKAEGYSNSKSNELRYEVLVEWGGIDPVRVKSLVFVLDERSDVSRYRIDDWRK